MENLVKNNKLLILIVYYFVFTQLNLVVAQSFQNIDTHPSIEIDEWYTHEGDLTKDELLEDNPSIWKLEKLEISKSEKHIIKWYKQDLQIPEYLLGFDLILYVHADPSTIVYQNGIELVNLTEDYCRVFLSSARKVDEKLILQVKTQSDIRKNRFYSAKIVGMPSGYGHFISSNSFESPSDGIAINDWKFRMNADEEASQLNFDDSGWEQRISSKGWRGEMQHAWYRTGINLPEKIDGFEVEGKPIRLLTSINDKGEIWVNGKFLQKFRESDGNVIISSSASIDSSYLIAIKSINEWGVGDVRSARIITNEAYKILLEHENIKSRLNRLDEYCQFRPFPEMSIINKVSEVIQTSKNLSYTKAITLINNKLSEVEAKLAHKPAFLISPYLQNLQSDEITIMWETVYPSYGKVLYGENDQFDMEVFENEIPSTMHEITLDGLKPGKTYNFVVESGDISSKKQKFTTKKTEIYPFNFVVLGDTRSRHDIHKKIVNGVIKENPLFVINTGDLVGDGKEKGEWKTFFSINKELMGSTPYYPVLGNHERNSKYYFDYFNLPNNESYYSFTVGDALFIILDSEGEEISDLSYTPNQDGEEFWRKNYGEYFSTQKKWLKNVLDLNKEVGFIFVFQHKPMYSVMNRRARDAERFRDIWGDIFEKHNVQAFINGHDHHYHHALKNNVHYITTAGGGAGLYNIDAPLPETVKLSKIEHFVHVKVSTNEAALHVIDIDGNEIDKIIVDKRKTH